MAKRAPQDCVDAIRSAAGEISDDEIAGLLEQLQRRAKKIGAADPLTGDRDALARAAAALANEERVAAIVDQRSRAINVLRKQERSGRYDAAEGRESEALRSQNVGSVRGHAGAARSIDADRLGIESGLIGPLIGELREKGVLGLLKGRMAAFDRDVANELGRIDSGANAGPSAGGLNFGRDTGNAGAKTVATILAKYQEMARLLQNDAGAFIGKLPGWIVTQTHDQLRIAKAGFEAWRDFIAPKLDDRTFADLADGPKGDAPAEREAMLRRIWVGLSSGVHEKSNGASDWLMGFTGPGNLARRASQERVLHFTSADDWFDYNQRFGGRSLWEAAHGGLARAARNTALMRVYGTNPEAAFEADLQQLMKAAAERGDVKQVRKLRSWVTRSGFETVNGTANIAGDPTLAAWGSAIRAVQSMAKLGGVVLSSLPDVAIHASTLRHNGIGYLEGAGSAFASIMRGRGSEEQRAIADLIGVGFDAINGHILARFSATDTVPGRMSKLMDLFFRANLLTWWTDAQKTGAGLMLARNLANNAARGFADLHPRLSGNLRRFNIGEGEWNALRRAEMRVGDGEHFLTPDAVRALPDEAVRDYLGKQDASADEIGRGKRDLETALRSYYLDQVGEATTLPGAAERSVVTLGTSAGTPLGEAMRFVMQFKSFGITFARRSIGRELTRGDKVDYSGLALLIGGTTALGYLSLIAKEAVKGLTPRAPNDWRTWVAAMQQGGGAGIYGDFLFGQYNRFGGGGLETLMGPSVGSAGDLLRVFAALRDGQDAKALGLRTLVNNTPFVNLFYTRMALDYLVLYHLQEAMNPGFLKRMEKRVAEQNGQNYWLQPSSTIARGGGFK